MRPALGKQAVIAFTRVVYRLRGAVEYTESTTKAQNASNRFARHGAEPTATKADDTEDVPLPEKITSVTVSVEMFHAIRYWMTDSDLRLLFDIWRSTEPAGPPAIHIFGTIEIIPDYSVRTGRGFTMQFGDRGEKEDGA